MTDARITSFLGNVEKVLTHLKGEYAKLQTGRANAALVENIEVDAYGQKQQLRSVAGITIPEVRTIMVQPWDRSIMQSVEKALQMANLGANPVNNGTAILLNFPTMTQERRVQLAKVVHQLAEEARISLRKHRQEAQDSIKLEKDEDVRETLMEELQKAVDEGNAKFADGAKRKEEEMMKV